MFNLNNIGTRIADPDQIQKSDIKGLKELSKKYPYSSLFSLMYLIALKRYGDIHFEDELKQHSYRISDRYNLYLLIEGENSSPIDIAVNNADSEETHDSEEDLTLQNDPEIPETETITSESFVEDKNIPAEITTEKEELKEITENDYLVEVQSENGQEETEIQVDEESTSKEAEEPYFGYEFSIDELDGLEFIRVDKEIVLEEEGGLNSDNQISDKADDPATLTDEEEDLNETVADEEDDEDLQTLDENIQLHIIASGYHLEPLSEEEEEKLAEREGISEEKPTKVADEIVESHQTTENPTSFLGWLHADKNFVETALKDPTKSNKNVENFSDFNPLEKLSGEKERPKTEFFSPSKKAKESLDESTLPVSETLAKIFVLQGNYPKAINVYEQLMLKFPEKKVFFADSIAQIKEKLNTIE